MIEAGLGFKDLAYFLKNRYLKGTFGLEKKKNLFLFVRHNFP